MRQTSANSYQHLSSRFILDTTPATRPPRYSVGAVTVLMYGAYLLLAALVLGILLGGAYLGIGIVLSNPFGLTSIFGFGLMAASGGGVFFVARFFLFAQSIPNQDLIVVAPEEQPRLFELVENLAKAVGTHVPPKLYFSPEVNVRLRYPSNFLGLFMPYPVGLEIGLGLVNSLTVSELQAVVTHELNQAPPRHITIRGYMYAIHCVFYNIAHLRSQQEKWLDDHVATLGLPGWIARAGRWVGRQARWLLQQIYWLGKDHYQQATHQAIYRADQQTMRLVGSDTLVATLRRTDFGQLAFKECRRHLNNLEEQEQISEDIYANHRATLAQLAATYALPLINHLPVVSAEALAKYQLPSRINLQHPGRSRPSRVMREQEIQAFSVDKHLDTQSAWRLFRKPAALRRAMTRKLYRFGSNEKNRVLSLDTFGCHIQKKAKQCRVSSEYHGFYDRRFLQPFEPAALVTSGERICREMTFDMIYNEDNRKKITSLIANRADLEMLKQIQAEPLVSSFEYDGVRYRRQDAGKLLMALGSELAFQDRWLSELDRFAFLWHLERAYEAEVSSEYVARHQALMHLQKAYQHFSKNQRQIGYWQNQLLHKPLWTKEEIKELTIELSTVEACFKGHLRMCPELTSIQEAMPELQWQNIIPYLRSEQMYHMNVARFDKGGFAQFTRIVSEVNAATEQAYRQSLRSVTDYQLGLQVAQEESSYQRQLS